MGNGVWSSLLPDPQTSTIWPATAREDPDGEVPLEPHSWRDFPEITCLANGTGELRPRDPDLARSSELKARDPFA